MIYSGGYGEVILSLSRDAMEAVSKILQARDGWLGEGSLNIELDNFANGLRAEIQSLDHRAAEFKRRHAVNEDLR